MYSLIWVSYTVQYNRCRFPQSVIESRSAHRVAVVPPLLLLLLSPFRSIPLSSFPHGVFREDSSFSHFYCSVTSRKKSEGERANKIQLETPPETIQTQSQPPPPTPSIHLSTASISHPSLAIGASARGYHHGAVQYLRDRAFRKKKKNNIETKGTSLPGSGGGGVCGRGARERHT